MKWVWIILKPSALPASVCGKILAWNLWSLVPKGWAALDHTCCPQRPWAGLLISMEGAKFSRDSVQLGGSGYSLWCGSSVCTQPAPHLEVSAARLPYTVGGAEVSARPGHTANSGLKCWVRGLCTQHLLSKGNSMKNQGEGGQILDFITHVLFLFSRNC